MAETSTLRQRLSRAIATGAAASRAWRVLLLLLFVVVSYFALSPTPPEDIGFAWDKLNHVLAFAALAFSAWLGYPASRAMRVFWFCALVAYGGLIEILQLFVPGRSSEWSDLLGDTVGIVFGAVIATAALRVVSALSMRNR
jgi:VanZ family protein